VARVVYEFDLIPDVI